MINLASMSSSSLFATRSFGSAAAKRNNAAPEGEASAVEAGATQATQKASSPARANLIPFAQVADNARAFLDEKYAVCRSNGQDINYQTMKKKQGDFIYNDMDRRQLFAVFSNAGGHFSKDEQDSAQAEMSRRQAAAMWPPNVVTPVGGGGTATELRNIGYLEEAGPEEQASAGWLKQRATAQYCYESDCQKEGKTPDPKVKSTNPLVNLLSDYMHSLKYSAPRVTSWGGGIRSAKDDPLMSELGITDAMIAEQARRPQKLDIRA